MRYLTILILALLLSGCGDDQSQSHFDERMAYFQSQNPSSGGVVLWGDSITEYLEPISSGFINRGIELLSSREAFTMIGEINRLKPRLVILLLGTNDISHGERDNLEQRLQQLTGSIQCDYRVVSILPRNSQQLNIIIDEVNLNLSAIYGDRFIDINNLFLDTSGMQSVNLFSDAVHPNKLGNLILLNTYINIQ